MTERKFFRSRNWMKFLCFFLFVGLASLVSAQNKSISGVVKDANGETIISASVIVKGTNIGTVTDFNGEFKLDVPSNAKTLLVSYIGMKSKEVAINGTVFKISLEEDTKLLDDVVVIGYGTQRKRDLTGSVASVSDKVLKDIPVANVAEALTGKLTGVQVTTSEGSPDAEIKIRVRGGGSITQSNSPLYIVDGFARESIKDIAPSEIQSIDVLKDASSTAIYGSRGANGVIIITTKSAEKGKLQVTYSGYAGIKNITKILDVLSPFEFAQKQYERASWGNDKIVSDYETYFGHYGDIDLYNYVNGTNWQKETFGRTGVTQNHTVSVAGGSEKLQFNANYNRVDDKAIMLMSSYKRDNVSLKLNYKPLKWLKADVSGRMAFTTIYGAGANDVTGSEKSTSDSRVKSAVIFTPIALKNLVSQDDDIEASASLYSPLQSTADNDRYQKNRDANINGGFTININKNLSFRSTAGVTATNKNDKRFYGLSSYYVREGGAEKRLISETPEVRVSAPAVLLTNSDIITFQNTNVLNYKINNIFKGHNLSAVLGHEYYNRSNKSATTNIEALPLDYNSKTAWSNLSAGFDRYGTLIFRDMDDRMVSFFGRVNYDMYDKYMIALTMRADGSSKFSGANQWGYFPSVSAGWRISDEKFMSNATVWLSNLKLRGSYGESGNNRIDNSAFVRTYKLSNSNYVPTSIPTSIYTPGDILANANLKWETTITRGIGLDYGFFKDRINGSVDIYSNRTEDVLIKMPISGVGYSYQWQNAATTANKGIEFSTNIAIVQTKKLNINFSFNISANQNRVVDLGNLSSYRFNEGWTSMTEGSNSFMVSPNNPIGLIYGYVNQGYYAADEFVWSSGKWAVNETKYPNKQMSEDGQKVLYYYDNNGVKFVDNSSIDGLSWGPGAMRLKDVNDDGVISDLDREKIGDTNPKHFGAFTFSGDYAGFDASINFNWVYGNQVYNANKIEMSSLYYRHRNMLDMGETSYTQIDWTTGNRITDTNELTTMNTTATIWAAPTGRYATTSWAIEDGSFLRLNNITLGYTVPSKLTKKIHVQKIRVYGSAYNVALWTKYSGYDPEVDSRRATPATPGVDYSAYPKSRSYNIGLNLTF